MNDDYETVVSWIAERAPTEVYAALVRLRLNDNTSETQKRMGEVIREDSKLIAELRAEVKRLQKTIEQLRAASLGNFEALVEAQARLSDRVAEVERLRRERQQASDHFNVAQAEVERLTAEANKSWEELRRSDAENERLRAALDGEATRLETYAEMIAGTDEEGLARSTADRLRNALAEEKE
jgi:capsule polysaccharide export protein KpsE/RkpR